MRQCDAFLAGEFEMRVDRSMEGFTGVRMAFHADEKVWKKFADHYEEAVSG